MRSRSLYFPSNYYPEFPNMSKIISNSNNIVVAANNLNSTITQTNQKIDTLSSEILQNNIGLVNIENKLDIIGDKIDNANSSITLKIEQLSVNITNSCNNIKESIKLFVIESLDKFEDNLVLVLNNKYVNTDRQLKYIVRTLEHITHGNKYYKICIQYSKLAKLSNKLSHLFRNYSTGKIQEVCLELTEPVYRQYALEIADLKLHYKKTLSDSSINNSSDNYSINNMSDHNSSLNNISDTLSEHNSSLHNVSDNMSDHNSSLDNVSDNMSDNMSDHNSSLHNVSDNMSEHNSSLHNVSDTLSDTVSEHNLSKTDNTSDILYDQLFDEDSMFDNSSSSSMSSIKHSFFENYESLRKSLADCLTGLRQATIIYTELVNSKDLICKYRQDLRDFDDVNALIERIKYLKSRMGLFEEVIVKAPKLNIKIEYLEYIKLYGPPQNGVFDADKLGNIIRQLALSDSDSSSSSSSGSSTNNNSQSNKYSSTNSDKSFQNSSNSSITNSL